MSGHTLRPHWFRNPRVGTVSCECGWSRTQRWWLPAWPLTKAYELHQQHKREAHQ